MSSGGLRWGVEPICQVLEIAPSTYYDAKARPPSARAERDAVAAPEAAGAVGAQLLGVRAPQAHQGGAEGRARGRPGPGRPADARRGHPRREPLEEAVHDPLGPRRGRARRTCCAATSPPPARTRSGWRTSPTARRGPGSSTSRSSSTCSPAASSAGRRPRSMTASLVVDALNMAAWVRRGVEPRRADLPLRRRRAIHVHRPHRPPRRHRRVAVDRHRRRQLR